MVLHHVVTALHEAVLMVPEVATVHHGVVMVLVEVSVEVPHRPAGMVEVAADMVLEDPHLVDHHHLAPLATAQAPTMDRKVAWPLSSASGRKINLSPVGLHLAVALVLAGLSRWTSAPAVLLKPFHNKIHLTA